MRIGVISDTHGRAERTLAAVRMLESLDVERVLHCGDIGSPQIPPLLSQWRVDYVSGNVDHDTRELAAAVADSKGTFHGRFADLEIEGVKIAVLHSDDQRRFRETIAAGDWQIVCYGHTHVADLKEENGVWVLNPGALHRTRQPSIAVIDLPEIEIHQIAVGDGPV